MTTNGLHSARSHARWESRRPVPIYSMFSSRGICYLACPLRPPIATPETRSSTYSGIWFHRPPPRHISLTRRICSIFARRRSRSQSSSRGTAAEHENRAARRRPDGAHVRASRRVSAPPDKTAWNGNTAVPAVGVLAPLRPSLMKCMFRVGVGWRGTCCASEDRIHAHMIAEEIGLGECIWGSLRP